MVEILADERRCPACGTANKIENIFCINCGVNVIDYEPSVIEVTDNGKSTFYFMVLCPMLIGLFIVIGITNLFFSMARFEDIIGFVLIFWGIMLLIFVPILIFKHITLSKTCRFAISNEKIEFSQSLKNPPVQIYWSDFDTIKLKVGGTRTYDLIYGARGSDIRTLRIDFLRESEAYRYGFKFFHDTKVRQVLNLIIDHAKIMKKNISASRRARRYYKLKI